MLLSGDKMDPKVIPLMVDVLEKRLDNDVMAYQPSDEDHRFAVQIDKTVMLVDEPKEVFVPLKRGRSFTYIELKNILEELDLNYKTRTEYLG